MYIELFGLATLAVYFVSGASNAANRRTFMGQYALIACASWFAESIAIYGYGFYEYSSQWNLRIGNMPLLVMLAWPAMIFSARDLARLFVASERRVSVVTVLIVLLDAAFMEPICVEAGLWRWNHPGMLQVPIVGILGWGVLAAACVFWLSTHRDATKGVIRFLLGIAAINVITHTALLLIWWCCMRFLTVPISSSMSIAGIWSVVVVLIVCMLAQNPSHALPSSFVILRTPVALLISSLLLQSRINTNSLLAHCTAIFTLYGVGIAMTACRRLQIENRLDYVPQVRRASTAQTP